MSPRFSSTETLKSKVQQLQVFDRYVRFILSSEENKHANLNQSEVDFEFESNEVPEVGMTFKTLEDAVKFYKDYSKAADFSRRVRSTNKKRNEIKNQLITCSRERKWKSKISLTEKTNPSTGLNCPARIYIHILKDISVWIISKFVLHHSHPCCPNQAEMLKQHRELSMFVRRRIENNEEAGIRPSKTYQSFVAATGGHRELNFIEKEVRNFITQEMRNELELFSAEAWSCGQQVAFSLIWVFFAELYKDRHIWILIYLDHHFWAEMRSTQRSESMHVFFNKTAHLSKSSNNTIIASKARSKERERESDAADFHTIIPCAIKSSIEAQFQHVYTHQKFRKVQAQFREKVNCITRSTNSALGYSVYEVVEQVSNSTFNKFVVTYDSIAGQVKCLCLLFESRGILCRHALSVLIFERVNKVSPRYILERWSKNVKRRYTLIKSSHDEPLLEPKSKRFNELVFRLQNICEFASKSEELTSILHRAYDNVMVEMQELKAKRKRTCSLSHEDTNLESARFKVGQTDCKCLKEKENESSKRVYFFQLNLFDGASVVQPNSSQYHGHIMNYQFRGPVTRNRCYCLC
ncbi:hypothetical protein Ahy_B05g078720 [Arachis hypogaea]|uniref:Protein FAR1-RELATED SEQUENCE n=1 Tax=Arachis hypogaea TaxID=3818 RepID=A0A444Z7U5_ARAHY|nr:hypothetical protein Ahy_B05g078720 [Arachis hypogaea]